jgi:SNF2 family DNA or RNA helicase
VEWLWKQYAEGKGGLLGDEMGLGKTVQMAAFLTLVLGKSATAADKDRRFPLPEKDSRQVLLVVPASTLGNWQRELRTWGCFRLSVMHSSGGTNSKNLAIEAAIERNCEIVLTTYQTMASSLSDLQRMSFEVAIFDEIHTMKTVKSKTRKAAMKLLHNTRTRRYGMSGTPMSNEYEELWSLFDFVSAEKVGTRADFKQFYSRLIQLGQTRTATPEQQRKRLERVGHLKELMDRWMLQRFKSVLGTQIPRKFDHVVFCRLAPQQEEVYERIIESEDYQLLRHMDTKPCYRCGTDRATKKCCPLGDFSGILT